MRVIKKGNMHEETMVVVCKNCGATLELMPKDVINDFPYYHYNCKECNEMNYIKRKEMTKTFRCRTEAIS